LKRARFETEALISNTFSSIIKPLDSIQQNLHSSPTTIRSDTIAATTDFDIDNNLHLQQQPSEPKSDSINNFNTLNVYGRVQSSSKLYKVYGSHSLRNGNVILR